jgi:hypothetical protein
MWPFKPSRKKFAKLVTRGMRERGFDGPMEYDAEKFRLTSGSAVHNLQNVYADYCATPRLRRKGALDIIVTSAMESHASLPETLDEVRLDLLPKIRERFFHEVIRLRSKAEGTPEPAVSYQVFAEHLAVDVVYDTPSSVRSMPPDEMDKWGLTLDEAFTIARAFRVLGSANEAAINSVDFPEKGLDILEGPGLI